MRRWWYVAGLGVSGALGLALSGCAGPGGSWQLPSFMRPPPPAPTRYYQPSVGGEINNNPPGAENEEHHEHAHSRRSPEHIVPAAVATPAPPVQPVPKPTVTLADGPSKERAQRLLNDAGAKLAKVDRKTLGADSATTYDQANNFLRAGRKAETEDDYVAASGFAEKAAVLAAKLVPASR